jgi:N-acetylmuramoyl-L-alanine amidase
MRRALVVPDANGPVGDGNYEVEEGDCMSSIAEAHGFFWETLWKLSENLDLKAARKNPNVLLAGDRVFIPEKRIKEESCPTEQKHKFKKKGAPCKLKIRILEPEKPSGDEGPDGKGAQNKPRANVPYLINIDGKLEDGKTDGDGIVEITVPPGAKKGTLKLEPGTPNEVQYKLKLGGLDPIEETSGMQARLNQLGFNCGPVDGKVSARLKQVIKEFQQSAGLNMSGEMDDATRAKLRELYDGEK